MLTQEQLLSEYIVARQQKEEAEGIAKQKRRELEYVEGLILEEGEKKLQHNGTTLGIRFEDRAQCSNLSIIREALEGIGLDLTTYLKRPEIKSRELAKVLKGFDVPEEISIYKKPIFTLRRKKGEAKNG